MFFLIFQEYHSLNFSETCTNSEIPKCYYFDKTLNKARIPFN